MSANHRQVEGAARTTSGAEVLEQRRGKVYREGGAGLEGPDDRRTRWIRPHARAYGIAVRNVCSPKGDLVLEPAAEGDPQVVGRKEREFDLQPEDAAEVGEIVAADLGWWRRLKRPEFKFDFYYVALRLLEAPN